LKPKEAKGEIKMYSLLKKYNNAIIKLNNLEKEGEQHIFDLVPAKQADKITLADVEYIENHYLKMKEIYKENKLGIYE
jgi:hypothetical protein